MKTVLRVFVASLPFRCSPAHRVTPAGGFAASPKWSVDSKRIICYETTELGTWYAQHNDAVGGQTQIVSMDVATGTRAQHTSGYGIRCWPQWLPDGRIGYLEKEAAIPILNRAGPRSASVGGDAHL